MYPKDIANLIYSLEVSNPLENQKFFGVCVWPVIRNSIFSLLEEQTTQIPEKKGKRTKPFISFFLFLSSLCKFRRGAPLLLTDMKFNEEINGTLYYKEFQALSDLYAADSVMPMMAVSGEIQIKKNNLDNIISFEFLKILTSFLAKLIARVHIPNGIAKKINMVLDLFLSRGGVIGEASLVSRKVASNVIFVVIFYIFIKAFLRVARPQKAYVVCYYSPIGMAFCAACRYLNIDVVDIQHGVSGRYHRAYSYWHSVDGELPNTLPNEYWVWSQKDYEQISVWCNSLSQSKALLRGNIWRDFCRRTGRDRLALLEWRSFFNSLVGFEKRVVITLQKKSLPPLFMSVINNAPANWVFLIRGHPSFIGSALSLSEDLPNVYYTEPSKMPIFTLMSMADFNITEWSASVYDAIMEGVPSIVTSPKGRDYFEDFIENNRVFFECRDSEVIRIISEFKS